MGWLADLLAQILGWLLKVLSAPVAAQAQKAGEGQQAAADAAQAQQTTQAMAQAQTDAPKDVASVEKDLDAGSF